MKDMRDDVSHTQTHSCAVDLLAGLGWAGSGWAGLDWAGLGWKNIKRTGEATVVDYVLSMAHHDWAGCTRNLAQVGYI